MYTDTERKNNLFSIVDFKSKQIIYFASGMTLSYNLIKYALTHLVGMFACILYVLHAPGKRALPR